MAVDTRRPAWLKVRLPHGPNYVDLKDIMRYGVMSTPGVVINGKVVHAGGVPSREKVEQWLSAA
ncbi:MAG: thioredoxin family protein [Firmicutes bacterium]|nr:thioredoxin family protein [Bacillota bacterium]